MSNDIILSGLKSQLSFGTPKGWDFRRWVLPVSEDSNLSILHKGVAAIKAHTHVQQFKTLY